MSLPALKIDAAPPAAEPGRAPPARTRAARWAPALDERRRSFLRMVSHELRTPLNSIIGFSEIISAELHGPIGDPRYTAHAQVIRQSGLKLLKMVNQVLEIARLETGAGELTILPELAAAAVRSATREQEGEADTRGVRFSVHVEPAELQVMADARGLQTILTNLLQNAVAFSPDGGEVRIDVRLVRNSVAFVIADDGEGVAPEDVARLLQPFEQGENALTRRGEGAGLGLPIVQLLCRDMGGRLHLHAEAGKGLTAVVRLPAAAASMPGSALEPMALHA